MPHRWFNAPCRSWSLRCSADGFDLLVTDHVRWRRAIAMFVGYTLSWLGHPCCYMGIGRIVPIGAACRAVLTWAMSFDDPGSRPVTIIPLTTEQARSIDPALVDDWLYGDE